MEVRCTVPDAHEEAVLAVTMNVHRDEVYSAGQDGVIKLWDVSGKTGKLLRIQKGHKGWVTDLLWVPALHLLFSASVDGTLFVWGEKGRLVAAEAFGDPLHCLSWNAKRKHLLVSVGVGQVHMYKVNVPKDAGGPPRGDSSLARLKRAEQADAMRVLKLVNKDTTSHTDVVSGLCSSDAGRVYTTSFDRSIAVHDTEKASELKLPKFEQCHSAAICSSTLDTDNNWILTGGYEGAVKIFSQEGRCLDYFQASTQPITSVAYVPSLRQYWAAGKGMMISVYDPRTPTSITSLVRETARLPEFKITRLKTALGGRGDTLVGATHDRCVVVWKQSRVAAHRVLRGHFDWIEGLCSARRPGRRRGTENDAPQVFTSATDGLILRWTPSSALNTDMYKCEEEFTGHRGAVTTITYEPELDVLISGSEDGDVRVWNLDNSRERTGLKGEDSEDKSKRSTPAPAAAARKRDQETNDEVTNSNGDKILAGHTSRISGVVVCADFVLVSASHDRSLRFWDLHTGHDLAVIEMAHPQPIAGILYCQEREELLTWAEGSDVAFVWSSYRREVVYTLGDHNGEVQAACWCDALEVWVTAAADNYIRIFDATGRVSRLFRYRGEDCTALLCEGIEAHLFVATLDCEIRGYSLLAQPLEEDVGIFGDEAPPPLLAKWSGHTDCIRRIIRIPERKQYLSVGWDKSLRFWHAPTGSSLGGYGGDSNVNSPADVSSPDGPKDGAGEDSEERFISSYEREHPLIVPKALRQKAPLQLRFTSETPKVKQRKGTNELQQRNSGLPAVLDRQLDALDRKLLQEHYIAHPTKSLKAAGKKAK